MADEDNDRAAGDDQPPAPEIIIQPEHLAGVWANYAQVVHSEHEFTLDSVRLDFSQGSPPRRGIVVARVAAAELG